MSRVQPSLVCRTPMFLMIAIALVPLSLLGQEASQNAAASGPPAVNAALAQALTPQIRQETVAELSPGSELRAFGTRAGHLFWIEKKAASETAWLDGKQVGRAYDQIHDLGVRGEHVKFAARRNSKWVIVIDGEERTPEFDDITDPQIADEGSIVAFAFCRQKKCRIMKGGTETGPELDEIRALSLSEDQQRYLYLGMRNKKCVLVLNGTQIGPDMDKCWRFTVNPAYDRAALLMRLDNKWTWAVDGKPAPSFDAISDLSFSRDGRHYAFAGANSSMGFGSQEVRASMVVDGEIVDSAKGHGMQGGWTLFGGQVQYMLKGPREFSADFHGFGDPHYSPDGTLVYAQRLGSGNVIVRLNGTAGPSFDDVVSRVVFCREGKHTAYIAKKGSSFVEVRDQTPGPTFPRGREWSEVGWIRLTEDGSRLSYELVRGGAEFKQGKTMRAERQVVINGNASPTFDAHGILPCVFSPGGEHDACVVHGAKETRDLVLFDAKASPLFDDVLDQSVRFTDDGALTYFARDGRKFLRVTEVFK